MYSLFFMRKIWKYYKYSFRTKMSSSLATKIIRLLVAPNAVSIILSVLKTATRLFRPYFFFNTLFCRPQERTWIFFWTKTGEIYWKSLGHPSVMRLARSWRTRWNRCPTWYLTNSFSHSANKSIKSIHFIEYTKHNIRLVY